MQNQKELLRATLATLRADLLWKLEGLSERELRWPMTPTGTNLLGLVKHTASVELGYLGEVFGRPSGIPTPWLSEDSEDNADMWATEDEPSADIIELYHAAGRHSEATIAALELDAVGIVPWWSAQHGRVTLQQILVHLIQETARHVGHADILRETIDGAAGLHAQNTNLPAFEAAALAEYRDRVAAAAITADQRSTNPPSQGDHLPRW